MKQGRRLIAILLLGGLLLAGCGPDGVSNGAGSAPAASVVALGAPQGVDLSPTPKVSPTVPPSPTATATPIPPPATPTPQPTSGPTLTPTVTQTPAPSPTPSATTPPITLNGLPVEQFVIMSPEVIANSRRILALGQEMGRNPHGFSKIGDSLVLTSHYLTKFDTGMYNLGPDYAYLQPAIDYFSGSFERYGVAVRVGLHAWSVFDPLWADKEWCEPNEDMLACEIRLNNPSIMLIRLGSNDDGPEGSFKYSLRKVIEATIAAGILPVLGTKADRFEGEDDRNNRAVRELAEEFQLPLWDFDKLADTLPGRGVGEDGVHLTIMFEHDYTDPAAFQTGYPVNDLSALILLHELLEWVIEPGE